MGEKPLVLSLNVPCLEPEMVVEAGTVLAGSPKASTAFTLIVRSQGVE